MVEIKIEASISPRATIEEIRWALRDLDDSARLSNATSFADGSAVLSFKLSYQSEETL